MSLPCLQKFKASTCFNLLNPGNISYPRLTRLFYINLKGNYSEDGVFLESIVAGVKITITRSLLVRLLGLDPECFIEPHPTKVDCVNKAKSEFLLPSSGTSRQLTHTSLKLEPKIIFLLLVRCIVPKENSKELLTDKLLELLFLVMSDFKVDTPSLIVEHMIRAVSSSRNTSLPYSNFLPLIFKEFNVPVEDEETMHTGPSLITEQTLQRLDIVKTAAGEWKFIKDLTSDEIKSLPNLKLKASHASSSSSTQDQLAERVKTLELDLLETREHMTDLALRNNVLSDRVDTLTERIMIYEEILIKQQEERNATTDHNAEKQGETSKKVDIPESSKKNDSNSPTEAQDDAWEEEAKKKFVANDDGNWTKWPVDESMLISLAQAAATIEESSPTVTEHATDEPADAEQAAEDQGADDQVVAADQDETTVADPSSTPLPDKP